MARLLQKVSIFNWIIVLLFIFALAGTESNAGTALSRENLDRAMWFWDKHEAVKKVLENEEAANTFIQFCKKPHGACPPIKTLFLNAQNYPAELAGKLAQFLRKAHAAGLRIEYLDGRAEWATLPSLYTLRVVDRVLNFNKGRPKEERFDGISLDIEPYILGNWKRKRDEISDKYIDLLKEVYTHIKSVEPGLIFNVAIPVFFSEPDPGGRILTKEVLKYTDYVVAMDYRDKGERIVAEGKAFLNHASEAGKKAIIGIETYDVVSNNEGVNYLTFHEEGWQYMEKELAKVEKAFQQTPGYGGIAIHYYGSYQELQAQNTNKVVPVPALTMQRTKPIQLDGSLKGFKGIKPITLSQAKNIVYTASEQKKKWSGTDDLSADLYVAWDDKSIYLGMAITDNKIVVTPDSKGGGMWVDDHIELWLAPEPEVENSTFSKLHQIGFSPGNFKDQAAYAFVWVPDDLSETAVKSILMVTKKTAKGYNLEAKIPLALFAGWNPKADPKIRFLVDVSDTDNEGGKQEQLMSLSQYRTWGDPNTFAKLSLKGKS